MILRNNAVCLNLRRRGTQDSLIGEIRIFAVVAFGWRDEYKVMFGRENRVLLLFTPSKISLSIEFWRDYWSFGREIL